MKYAAFLRGVNVGGNVKVPMEELRELFSSSGFSNVKTLLNSGNVIFETNEANETVIQEKIDQALLREFGRPIKSLLRSLVEVQQLIDAGPFNGIPVTPHTRLYVTFVTEGHTKTKDEVSKRTDKSVIITRLTSREICSVITITPDKNTTDIMGFLEKEFGKSVTTRNWNTVLRIVKN